MIQAVLPFRLIPRVTTYFTDLNIRNINFPSTMNSKAENANKVKSADRIIGFLDKEALIAGNSIGTKVELTNNEKKILCVYFIDTRTNSFEVFWPLPFNENLPTWEQYITDDESIKIAKVSSELVGPICKYFIHNPNNVKHESGKYAKAESDERKLHIHKCINLLNLISRCGFESGHDAKRNCTLFEPEVKKNE